MRIKDRKILGKFIRLDEGAKKRYRNENEFDATKPSVLIVLTISYVAAVFCLVIGVPWQGSARTPIPPEDLPVAIPVFIVFYVLLVGGLAVWDDRYQIRFGFWRPYVMDVIRRYLDCGDLHFGFARVKCKDCGHEYLLAFSCKRRHFCPSCHQKRVVEFGEWLCTEMLKYVLHRQWVFSIPKRLRI